MTEASPLTHLSDEALIERMAHRDERALTELHGRYARLLYALGHRMLHQREDVESCVQDAFLNAWNHAGRFDIARAKAKTWLVSIAHHRFLQELRDRPQTALELEDWDTPTQSPELVNALMAQQALGVLDASQRRLVELAYFRGHSHAALAELTGLPLGTVKSRLRAALDRMRGALGEPPARPLTEGGEE